MIALNDAATSARRGPAFSRMLDGFVSRIQAWGTYERALTFLLAAVAFNGMLWALLSRHIPDEPSYFGEIANLATSGTTESLSGHVVGTFAYTGAAFHFVGSAFGLDELFAVRLLGVILTSAVTWIAAHTMLQVSGSRFVALGTAALVGFHPMYSFLGSSSNSDTMVVFWTSLALLLSVLVVTRGATPPVLAMMAATLVLGYLTKDRFLIAAPVMFLALAWDGVRRIPWPPEVREWVRARVRSESFWLDVAVAALIALLLGGSLIRGLADLGLADSRFGPMPSANTAIRIWSEPQFVERLVRQFWAYFGYLHVPAPPWFYAIPKSLAALALVGALVSIGLWLHDALAARADGRRRVRMSRATRLSIAGYLFLAVAVIVNLYAIAQYQVRLPGGTQGRYLFPSIVPICGLIMAGVDGLVPARMRRYALAVLVAGCLVVNAYALFVIQWRYFY